MNEEAKPKSNPVLRFLPAFAAGIAAGALGAWWAARSVPPPDEPPVPLVPTNAPAKALDFADVLPFDLEPVAPTLAWRAKVQRRKDVRFPQITLTSNRKMFGPDATNVPPCVSVSHEGRPIAVRVDCTPKDGTNDWICLVPVEPVGPGEFAVRIGKDFPDPAGMPALADFVWKRQYAPEPVRVSHVEIEPDPFESRVGGGFVWIDGAEFSGEELETVASNLVVAPSVGPVSLVKDDNYRSWHDDDGNWHYGCRGHYALTGDFLAGERYTLRFAAPELGLPDLSTDAVCERAGQWLPLYAGTATTAAELHRIDLGAVLRGLLSYEQQQEVERLAPSHITVPTGSRIRVDYRQGAELPVLRVRLQECFGLRDTPRVDDGRRPVLMELLSPGFKPVQLTTDLASFWRDTYFEVRKELRRRYPRHAWPDDPLAADPVRGVRRK